MKTFFVDSNFFIEYVDPQEIPWGAIIGNENEVHLIVPSTVIIEIENNKSKGNSRKAKRARKASALFKKALMATKTQIQLRQENPKVTLSLSSNEMINFENYPQLDRMKPDHQIAAEFANYSKENPETVMLSNDTLLILTVKNTLGLKVELLPDGWKLPTEKDPRDKEIERLQSEVRNLSKSIPDILVTVKDKKLNDCNKLEIDGRKYETDSNCTEQIVREIMSRSPMKTHFSKSAPKHDQGRQTLAFKMITGSWYPPSDEEIEKYQSEEYPQWEKDIVDRVERSSLFLSNYSNQVEFNIGVHNKGSENALDVRLIIKAYDGLKLSDSPIFSKGDTDNIFIPAAPKPPQGRYRSINDFSALMNGGQLHTPIPSILSRIPLNRNHEVDSNKFYWRSEQDELVDKIELFCKALPHKAETYNLQVYLFAFENKLGKSPRITIEVHASNLREPQKKTVPVDVNLKKMVWNYETFLHSQTLLLDSLCTDTPD